MAPNGFQKFEKKLLKNNPEILMSPFEIRDFAKFSLRGLDLG